MKIAVMGEEDQYRELIQCSSEIEWIRFSSPDEWAKRKDIAALFILNDEIPHNKFNHTNKPVFINSVSKTLQQAGYPKNVIRINGWPGFISKDLWEVSGILSEDAKNILLSCNKKFIPTADEPGFISARILAMIINEAYLTEADKVSSRKEIDTAMKLGTNYPWGPFEWAEKIGIKNIYELLTALSVQDTRYTPCASLALQSK